MRSLRCQLPVGAADNLKLSGGRKTVTVMSESGESNQERLVSS